MIRSDLLEYKNEIATVLAQVSGCTFEECVNSLVTPKAGQADLCSTIAFLIAKKNKQNPAKKAQEIAQSMRCEYTKNIEALGPYINFYFDNKFWQQNVNAVCTVGAKNILQQKNKTEKKRVIVEFPSVNPNKPWHVGHLRNAILGDSVARLFEYCGYVVQRIDYIDDLGLQVAQSYWGSKNLPTVKADEQLKKFENKRDHTCGWQYVEASKKFEDENVAKQVREILKLMEKGDNEVATDARNFAQQIVEAQYQTSFALGIYHDALIFESDIIRTVFKEGLEKIKRSEALVFEENGKNKGCWVVKLQDVLGFEGLENADKILIRSDKTATYTGKDVAFSLWKFGLVKNDFTYKKFIKQPNNIYALATCEDGEKHDFGKADISINVIGVEQSYPQKVISAVLQKMGYAQQAQNSIHLAYEHVVLAQGKFSGRAGTWIKAQGEQLGYSADELIEEVIKRAYERISAKYEQKQMEIISRAVGISALRFSFLRTSSNIKIVFDFDRALSLSGDSGPYIQYAYARAKGIMNKVVNLSGYKKQDLDFSKIEFEEKEIALLRAMIKWYEVVESCQKNVYVHPVCDYAIDLAGEFNKFYTSLPVISEEDEKRKNARVCIIEAYCKIMQDVMYILGIEPLDKM